MPQLNPTQDQAPIKKRRIRQGLSLSKQFRPCWINTAGAARPGVTSVPTGQLHDVLQEHGRYYCLPLWGL